MEHAAKTILAIQLFLDQVIHWAAEHADIQAVVLVGSYARGKATRASDIDLVLLVDEPKNYLADPGWIDQFGPSVRQQVEDYGRLTSLRVWYEDGTEVKFGLTDPGWAASPLDEGTDRVLMDGVKVLYERKPLLSPVLEGFGEAEDLFTAMVQTIQQRVNAKMASQNVDFQHVWLSSPESKAIFRLHRQEIRRLPLRGRLHLARWLTLSDEIHGTGFANAVLELSAKELDPSDFAYLDEHLNHFRGWGPTDDFCINVLQPLLWKYPGQTLELLQQWNRSENPWKRRASVVVYTRKVGASGKFTRETLELCENLLWDKEDLVQKGVGWALKDGMRGDRTQVLEYVKALRRMGVSAVITLYAIRDLKGAERQKILEIHA
jgi:3-methyladenine DNA glycosylase AlkD/predicted nucleotidyltransferase